MILKVSKTQSNKSITNLETPTTLSCSNKLHRSNNKFTTFGMNSSNSMSNTKLKFMIMIMSKKRSSISNGPKTSRLRRPQLGSKKSNKEKNKNSEKRKLQRKKAIKKTKNPPNKVTRNKLSQHHKTSLLSKEQRSIEIKRKLMLALS